MKKKNYKNAREKQITVAISGGFDPIHVGHVRMIKAAKALGDYLVVIMNNDNWLKSKKGYVFMPEKERQELLEAIAGVDKVVITSHHKTPKDMSVVKEIIKIKPNIFANGGDRKLDNIPEVVTCRKLGIKMVFNVGHGGKIQSSSWLVKKASEK